MKKKLIIVSIVIFILISALAYYGIFLKGVGTISDLYSEECKLDIPKIISKTDYNNNGIPDSEDILIGARKDADNKPTYVSKYYTGGYPPDNEGVCTDVVWRAFKEAGYNLKDMVDKDIRSNVNLYPRVSGKPDANIDFRRVPNLKVFFDRKFKKLILEIIPNNIENLSEWQGGDIVVFGKPTDHIAIVSDKRNKEGVPYIIHNSGPYTQEVDVLLHWKDNISPIIGHYRIKK